MTDKPTAFDSVREDVDHPCQVCGAPGARSYCPDCGSEQVTSDD